jgi:hypothetical protein
VVADIAFTPTFEFQPWLNNVDRITAGGPRGMNVRFDAIEQDLKAVGSVVAQVNAILTQPVAGPGPGLFTPPLVFSRSLGFTGWGYDQDGVLHPSSTDATPVASVMNLVMPENVKVTQFRAIGRYPGAPMTFSIGLFRASLVNLTQAPDKIAEVTNTTAGLTNPFDLTVPATANVAGVDPNSFRYFVVASATQVSDTVSTAMSLSTVQLVLASS